MAKAKTGKAKQTAFQKFLERSGACDAARLFVANRGGDFSRAYRANNRNGDFDGWLRWLAERLVRKSDKPKCCNMCHVGGMSDANVKAFVLAGARRKGWMA